MRAFSLAVVVLFVSSCVLSAEEVPWTETVREWQAAREAKLRSKNGWLTLAGRYPLQDGANTFGTGNDNDVIFPAALEGTGPQRLGTLVVDQKALTVTLKLADDVTMTSDEEPFTGVRVMGTATDKRDWVSLGRLSMHVIQRDGRFFLRVADNESPIRTKFPGCVWYPPNETFKVEARFIAYPEGRTLPIVNVIDEVSKQPCPGYVEFRLEGQLHRLDAIKEGKGLFFVFRDGTAGDTTYGAGRFLDVEEQPEPETPFTLDFNKAYNPPCAFSEYTTCPLPPRQNILKRRIEAGEKYRERD